jgi:protein-L-isoaspartate(D-aspartate) O-methyltransferase
MNDTSHARPDALRTKLADKLRDDGTTHAARIERALRTVPRHLFLPDIPIVDAYADQVVVTKRDDSGAALVSASQPTVIAIMLEQLDAHPDHRVMEIGAGTGYNAALLRELVGPRGQVITIDIDSEAAQQARTRLGVAGYTDVHVRAGDGALGDATLAPYDRIIITAGAWDLPPAWWEQLADDGRIVVPLRWRGLTRTVALDHTGDRLVSRSMTMCGFIPMRTDDGQRTLHLHDDVTIHYDEDQPIDPDPLRGVLHRPRSETWSGVTVGGNEPFDGVWLRLSITEPGTCRFAAQRSAMDSGLATPAIPGLNPAIVEQDSLAYFAYRRLTGPGDRYQLGAIGHGPEGDKLAGRIAEHIREWDQNRTAAPWLEVYPAGTPDEQLPPGYTIDKRHTRLTFAMEAASVAKLGP